MQKYPFPFRKAYFAKFFNYNYSELVMVKATLGLYRYSSYVIFLPIGLVGSGLSSSSLLVYRLIPRPSFQVHGLSLTTQFADPQVIPHPAPWPSL